MEPTRLSPSPNHSVLWLSIGLLVLLHLVLVERELLPVQRELAGLAPIHDLLRLELRAAEAGPGGDPASLYLEWKRLRQDSFPAARAPQWEAGPGQEVGAVLARLGPGSATRLPLLGALNEAISSLADADELILDSNLTRYHAIELLTHDLPEAVSRAYLGLAPEDNPVTLERINHSLAIRGIPDDVKAAARRYLAAQTRPETFAALGALNDRLEDAIQRRLRHQVRSYRLFESTALFVAILALVIFLFMSRAVAASGAARTEAARLDPRGSAVRSVRVLSLLVILGGCFGIFLWPAELARAPLYAYGNIAAGIAAFFCSLRKRRPRLLESASLILLLSATAMATEGYLTLEFLQTGIRFPPFLGYKLLPFVIAILAPPPATFSALLIALSGLLPVLEYFFLLPAPLRSALPLGEPWTALFYAGVSLVIFAYRNLELKLERNLAQALADKASAEKMLRSESRFRRLAESNLLGIVHSTASGKLLDANPYFFDLVGYGPEDFETISLESITAPEFRGTRHRFLQDVLSRGVSAPAERAFLRKDGKRIWALAGAARIEGSRDEIITMLLDITERKELQREREELLVKEMRARKEAEKTIQLRDDFIASASHELRTPLTPLKLWMQLAHQLISSGPLAALPEVARLRRSVDLMEKQVERLESLVEAMLTAVTIDAGKLVLERSPVDLAELIRSVLHRYAAAFERANCTLKTNLPEGIRGNWDHHKLRKAIGNVVENAVKFGPNRSIEITASVSQDVARIVVRDFGIGLPAEAAERIFDRFQKNVPTEYYGGLGLGLYIARCIIEAHRGVIRSESKPAEGATFTIELPTLLRKTLAEVG